MYLVKEMPHLPIYVSFESGTPSVGGTTHFPPSAALPTSMLRIRRQCCKVGCLLQVMQNQKVLPEIRERVYWGQPTLQLGPEFRVTRSGVKAIGYQWCPCEQKGEYQEIQHDASHTG